MKKLIFVALLAASLSGFAQEAKKGGVDKMLGKMTTELSLTADQQEKLKPILEEQMALKKDSKENPDHADANKAKGKEISGRIKAILTPEQIAIQKEKMEKAKGEGKKGKKEGGE
jgi:Spy/CpxP family protein refolding chaperone